MKTIETPVQRFHRLTAERAQAIRQNASRRMRGVNPLPVPAKPAVPMVQMAYTPAGDYLGRLLPGQSAPAGSIVKLEPTIF